MNFTYNDFENLRSTIGRVDCTSIRHPFFGIVHFAVVDCDDKGRGGWNDTRQYYGLMTSYDDVEQIKEIMRNGSKLNSLKKWLAST